MKKKILIVVTPIRNRGGIIRRLSLWAKYLTHSYDIRILCHTTDPSVAMILEKEGAEVINSPGLGRKGRVALLPGILAICKEIERYCPHAVISMFVWTDFLTSCAKRLCCKKLFFSIPHLIHIAGDPVSHWEPSIKEKIYKKLVSFSLRSCDTIISICRHDAEMVKKKFQLGCDKIHVIPIGIETSYTISKNVEHKPFTFGVVSRLSPVKNINEIIKSFKKVSEKHQCPLKLHIFGDGEELKNLLTLSRNLGLEDTVYLMGNAKNPYLAFDTIDCLLIFSHTEGTPRSILEAALRGVPSIAKNVGGISEIIQDGKTGYLIDTKEELIQKMKFYADNPEKTLEMGANATTFVNHRHSIEAEIVNIGQVVESHLS